MWCGWSGHAWETLREWVGRVIKLGFLGCHVCGIGVGSVSGYGKIRSQWWVIIKYNVSSYLSLGFVKL